MKKLMVNCATCDARNLTEEVLQNYESVQINAADILVSRSSAELISRYDVTLNAASVIEIPDGAPFASSNGVMTIKGGTLPEEGTYLSVNGKLTIEDDAVEALQRYAAIRLNGALLCPEGLAGLLSGKLTVNGAAEYYPDGAVLLKNGTKIDRTFVLRAGEKLYYAKRLIFLDLTLPVERLLEKGSRFAAKKVVLAESLAEALVERIDERAELVILPDGTAYCDEESTLDAAFLHRWGDKIYLEGKLTVPAEAVELLDRISFLQVTDEVTVDEAAAEAFYAKGFVTGRVNVKKLRRYGKVVSDRVSFKLSRAALEHCADGLRITDCATVKLAEDIPSELILEKLSISDCASVCCTEEQEGAVQLICEDVADISTGEGGVTGVGDLVKGVMNTVLDGVKGTGDTKVINAATYTF